ncbi:MAG: endonuclease III [Spirochaetes bacterium GWB1_66_5]|nr:MAG: endonuclease III [Spirochaetes bacterium GWB1_66_5]
MSPGSEPRVPWKAIFDSLARALKGKPLPAVSEVAAQREDPFAVLVSTMISLRTKDEVTAAASARLLARASGPAALAALSEAVIARLIFPAGFYRTKARHLRAAARLLLQRHGGRVPQSMENLLALPGVGRKTANLVRNLGFGLPGICVDTHVHRISNRLGWVRTRTPLETERALQKVLPRRWWIPVNGLLVAFGQRTCTPQSPRCSVCPIRRHCARVGVTRSR